jgi:hypothetical protein
MSLFLLKLSVMRFLFISLIVFTILTVHSACAYDNPPPVEIEGVSFNEDVIPIFEISCVSSGCHTNGGIDPILTADKAYESLQNGIGHDGNPFIDVESPDESALMEELDSGKMPPGTNLPQFDIETIRTWMAEGAKDN